MLQLVKHLKGNKRWVCANNVAAAEYKKEAVGLLLNGMDDLVIADGQGLRCIKLLLPQFSLTGSPELFLQRERVRGGEELLEEGNPGLESLEKSQLF